MRNLFRSLRVSYLVLIIAMMLIELDIVEAWQFVPCFMVIGLTGDVITECMEADKKKSNKGVR